MKSAQKETNHFLFFEKHTKLWQLKTLKDLFVFHHGESSLPISLDPQIGSKLKPATNLNTHRQGMGPGIFGNNASKVFSRLPLYQNKEGWHNLFKSALKKFSIFQLFYPKMVVISDGHFDISNKGTMLIYIERFGDLKKLVLLNIFMVFV